MSSTVSVGFSNCINKSIIIAIASYDTSAIKRRVKEAKNDGLFVDLTAGKKPRSVIVTTTNHILLCAINSDTIAKRMDSNIFIDPHNENEIDDKNMMNDNELNESGTEAVC